MNFNSYPNLIFTSSTISNGNMTYVRGDKQETLKNRQQFLNKLNIPDKQVVAMSLVHGNNTNIIQDKDLNHGILDGKYYLECDGLITNKKDIFLFMVTGDCLPIGLYDPKNQIIALIHASRHNLLTGIIKICLEKMTQDFQTNPQNLIVKIGPSIGPCCYKGNKSKISRYNQPEIQPYIIETETDYGADLWKMSEDLLQTSGILKSNIENQMICTYHSGEYYSHVKFAKENLPEDYRFATILGLKNE